MAEEPTPFSVLLAGCGTQEPAGRRTSGSSRCSPSSRSGPSTAERRGDGAKWWSTPLTKEKLLGVLDGLTVSLRQRLSMAWKSQTPPPTVGVPTAPMQFSELLTGLETVGVARPYVIESVFAVIKARRVDGAPGWFVRSSEMKLNPEERLGAPWDMPPRSESDWPRHWKW